MRPELSDEMHRILVKRITKALEAARYYPATIHPEEDAKKLLEPFREVEKREPPWPTGHPQERY